MTVLTAIRAAVLRTTGVRVTQVFASTEQIAVEMADLVNEVATDIARSHPWQALTKIATVVPDGGTVYALPVDYDRMAGGIEDVASWLWGYAMFTSVNQWMQFRSGTYSIISPGGWIILGNQFNFYPAPTGNADYPYISNYLVLDGSPAEKAAFTADDDTFKLDERLLTLGLIWRWLSQKGYDYTEPLATYELALSQAQMRDRGSRVYRSPTNRFSNVRVAYTGTAFP